MCLPDSNPRSHQSYSDWSRVQGFRDPSVHIPHSMRSSVDLQGSPIWKPLPYHNPFNLNCIILNLLNDETSSLLTVLISIASCSEPWMWRVLSREGLDSSTLHCPELYAREQLSSFMNFHSCWVWSLLSLKLSEFTWRKTLGHSFQEQDFVASEISRRQVSLGFFVISLSRV